MIKFFNIKTPLATHSICVHKSTIKDLWTVDIVAYGEWYSRQFRTLKECFNLIRQIFNKEKQNGKNKNKSSKTCTN